MSGATKVGILRSNHERFTVPVVMYLDWATRLLFPNSTTPELSVSDWLVELARPAFLFVVLWYRLDAGTADGLESLSDIGWFDRTEPSFVEVHHYTPRSQSS